MHAFRRSLLILCLSSIASAQAADRAERTLVTYVKSHQESATALLEQAVNINSGTMNFKGVRDVGELFRPRFEALGFKTEWVDGANFGRAGHLVARRSGKGKHILLIGHLDTVFEPDHPFQKFERIDGDKVRGPGTADMKGGIIVALTALEAMNKAGVLDSLNITVVLHGDEEDSGAPLSAARATLIAAAEDADIAIGLENAADDPGNVVGLGRTPALSVQHAFTSVRPAACARQ